MLKTDVNSKDELGYMGNILNNTLDEIKSIIISLKDISEKINDKVKYVNEASESNLEASHHITEAIEGITCAAGDTTRDMEISAIAVADLTNNIVSIKDTSLLLQNEAVNAGKLNSNVLNILKDLDNNANQLSEKSDKFKL